MPVAANAEIWLEICRYTQCVPCVSKTLCCQIVSTAIPSANTTPWNPESVGYHENCSCGTPDTCSGTHFENQCSGGPARRKNTGSHEPTPADAFRLSSMLGGRVTELQHIGRQRNRECEFGKTTLGDSCLNPGAKLRRTDTGSHRQEFSFPSPQFGSFRTRGFH